MPDGNRLRFAPPRDYRHAAHQLLAGVRRDLGDDAKVRTLAQVGGAGAPMDAHQFARLLRATSQTLDDEFFGLTSRPARHGTCAMMVDLILGCATLGAALEQACNFMRIVTDDLRLSYTLQGDTLEITFKVTDGQRDPLGFLGDYWLLYLHNLFSWVIGRKIALKELYSTCPEAPNCDRLLSYIRPSWSYGHSHNALVLSAHYWTASIVRTRGEWHANVERIIGQGILGWPDGHDSWTYRVRGLFNQTFERQVGVPRLADVAAHLCVSPQTLHRYLQQEGSSFQQLLDESRKDHAIELLERQHLSVEAAAQRLGFSEARSFSRAFKHWTGLSPSQVTSRR